MKTVTWSQLDRLRVDEIVEMVAEYAGEQSAIRYVSEFNRMVELAAHNPNIGKIGIVPNTRELYPIQGKYRIVYEVSGEKLHVLTVKATQQLNTPESFDQEKEEGK